MTTIATIITIVAMTTIVDMITIVAMTNIVAMTTIVAMTNHCCHDKPTYHSILAKARTQSLFERRRLICVRSGISLETENSHFAHDLAHSSCVYGKSRFQVTVSLLNLAHLLPPYLFIISSESSVVGTEYISSLTLHSSQQKIMLIADSSLGEYCNRTELNACLNFVNERESPNNICGPAWARLVAIQGVNS